MVILSAKQRFINLFVFGSNPLKFFVLFYIRDAHQSIAQHQLQEAIKDSWKRLLFPSLEREIRSELTQKAKEQALNDKIKEKTGGKENGQST